MRRLLLLVVALAAVAVPAALAAKSYPKTIALPPGFQPEGIEIGRGNTFYVGSIPTGAIFRGNLRTGKGTIINQGATTGRAAIGIEYHRGLLFVAGGGTGKAFVYNASSGALLREIQLATAAGGTFVNDVVIAGNAAWFTDSQRAVLYKVPLGKKGTPGSAVQAVPLTGDFQLVSGFNLNGIVATPNGKTLIAVQSSTGKLFTIDAKTGATRLITGVTTTNGDGLLLAGRTLYVVQNRDNKIAVLRLSRDLSSATLTRTITDPGFAVPTTIDRFGKWLYAVNARFGMPPGPYTVVKVRA